MTSFEFLHTLTMCRDRAVFVSASGFFDVGVPRCGEREASLVVFLGDFGRP
jgi:hypothetical protein